MHFSLYYPTPKHHNFYASRKWSVPCRAAENEPLFLHTFTRKEEAKHNNTLQDTHKHREAYHQYPHTRMYSTELGLISSWQCP